MSLQDDIFDVAAALEGTPEADAFERVQVVFGRLEAEVSQLREERRAIDMAAMTMRKLFIGRGV